MLEPTTWRGSSTWARFLTLSLLTGQLRLSTALKLQELHGDDPVLTGCADFLWVEGYGLYERYTGSGILTFHYVSVDTRDGALRHLKWRPMRRDDKPTLPGSYGEWELGNFTAGEYDTSQVFAKLENGLKCPTGSFTLTVVSPRANDPDSVKVYPYTSREKIYLDNAFRRVTMGNIFTSEFTDGCERIVQGIIAFLCYSHDGYDEKFNHFQIGHALKEAFMGFTKISLLFGVPGVELNDKLAGRAEEAISKILAVLDHVFNVGFGGYYVHEAFQPATNVSSRMAAPDTIAADAAHFVISKHAANDSFTIEPEDDVAQLAAPSQDPMSWVSFAVPHGLAAVELAMGRANLSMMDDVRKAVDFAKAATNATLNLRRALPDTGVEKSECSKMNALWMVVWNAIQIPILDFYGIYRARSIFGDGRTLWQQWFADKDESWWDKFFGEGRSSWERGLTNVQKATGRLSTFRAPKDNPADQADDTDKPVDEVQTDSQENDEATDASSSEKETVFDSPV